MAGNRVISAILRLNSSNFNSGMSDMERSLRRSGNQIGRFKNSAVSSFAGVAKGIAGMAAAYVGINALKDLGVGMIQSAASAQAMSAQFTAVFGEMETQAQSTVDELAKSFGMVSERVTPGFTKITSMMKGFGMSTKESMAAASNAMVLSADAAAFYDVAMVDAEGALTSFLKGNTSAAESIGIFATVTGMASFASAELGQDWKKLDEAGKQIVRLKYVEKMQGAAGATGQAARESEGLENILGNLRTAWDNLKAKLGVPILGPAIKGMQGLATWIGNVDTNKITAGFSKFGSIVKGVFTSIQPGLVWLKDTALPAIKEAIVNMYVASQPGLNWMKDVAFPALKEGIGTAVDKAKEMYNFFVDNWPLISPIIAGVAATIAAYKIGIVAITVATTIWQGVTTAATIAAGLLNGTLALSPFGWVVLAIGAVVAAGIALYQNWDTVKATAQSLWDKSKEVWMGIEIGFSNAWNVVKTAAGNSLNFIIDKINTMIGVINKIPGVKIPIVAKVEWGQAAQPANTNKVIKGNMESYAVGTNRVKRDMVANIHKDEMIIPAVKSRNLRKQGVTIDNIDKSSPGKTDSGTINATNTTNRAGNNNNIVININAQDKTVGDIINELVPMLQLRLANL